MNGLVALESWQTILRGSFEQFRDGTPTVSYLQDGQEFKITVKTQWWAPIAPLFDLFTGEWLAKNLLGVGGEIIDVWGEGLYTVVVWGRAKASSAGAATEYGSLFTISIIAIRNVIIAAIIAVGLAFAIDFIDFAVKTVGAAFDVVSMIVMVVMLYVMMTVMGKLLPGEGLR